MDNDRQIHTAVHDAVEVERSGSVKGADSSGLVNGTDGEIIDHGGAWFALRVGYAALPGAVGDDMRHGILVVERNTAAFFNGNAARREALSVQSDCIIRTARVVGVPHDSARNKCESKQYKQRTESDMFFHESEFFLDRVQMLRSWSNRR